MSFLDKILKRSRPGIEDILTPELLASTVSKKDSMQINAVYACVNIISSAIASLPFDIYRKTDNGREKAVKLPLYGITKNPSADMPAYNFMESLLVNLLIYGNAFVEVVRIRGQVRELNLIPSEKVTITKDGDGQNVYVVTGSDGKGQTSFPASSKKIMHVVGKSYNGTEGISPVQLCMRSLSIARALEIYGLNYFERGARPSGFLKVPTKLTEESAERLKRDFARNYQGTAKSGKPIVLEQGTEYVIADNGNDSSQFLESRRFAIEEICRLFTMPLWMVSETSKSTSWGSGIEAQGIAFVQYCIGPIMKRIEEAFGFYLLSAKEQEQYYFEFNIDGLLRGDQKSRFDAYHTAIMDGWMSPNEVREKENLPAIAGGDVYLLPVNMAGYAGEDKVEQNENG
jgi:HK97 family phage portal protein